MEPGIPVFAYRKASKQQGSGQLCVENVLFLAIARLSHDKKEIFNCSFEPQIEVRGNLDCWSREQFLWTTRPQGELNKSDHNFHNLTRFAGPGTLWPALRESQGQTAWRIWMSETCEAAELLSVMKAHPKSHCVQDSRLYAHLGRRQKLGLQMTIASNSAFVPGLHGTISLRLSERGLQRLACMFVP